MSYARNTSVSAGRSRAELERREVERLRVLSWRMYYRARCEDIARAAEKRGG